MREPNLPPEPPDRPPVQEIANRAATAGAGLAAAAKAVALADHKRMLEEHRRRTREGHVAMMRAAGFDPATLQTDGDDDMGGDVTVTGDIHVTMPQSSSAGDAQPKKPSRLSAVAGPLAAALLGTGLGAVGVATALQSFRPQTPAVQPPAPPPFVDTDTDTQYELRLSTGRVKDS